MVRSLAVTLSLTVFLGASSPRSDEVRTPPTDDQVNKVEQFLFVQNARSGSFDGERLTLDGVAPTIFFSDRPYRVFGHAMPQDFLEAWKRGPNSFAEDPPNAILSLIGDNHVASYMVTLSDPRYTNGDFSYKAVVDAGTIPAEFAESSLFIDNDLWAAVGGLAAGHLLTRRSERREAAAYEAGAHSSQAPSYYYHAAPAAPAAPAPPAPPPAPPAPPSQQSVASLLSQAVAQMEAYAGTASAADASYVRQLIQTTKSVESDYAKVAQ